MRHDLFFRHRDKLADALGREFIPRFDGGFARHLLQRAFDEIGELRVVALRQESLESRLEDVENRRAGDARRIAVDDDARPAERFDFEANRREERLIVDDIGKLRGGEVDDDRHEEHLHVDITRIVTRLELFEEDPLVKGVLVDERDSVGRLHDEVSVAELNGGSSVGCERDDTRRVIAEGRASAVVFDRLFAAPFERGRFRRRVGRRKGLLPDVARLLLRGGRDVFFSADAGRNGIVEIRKFSEFCGLSLKEARRLRGFRARAFLCGEGGGFFKSGVRGIDRALNARGIERVALRIGV